MTTHVDARAQPTGARRALPTTRLGRLACWLGLTFVVWFALNLVLVQLVQMAGDIPETRSVWLIVLSWAGFATGFVAGVVGLVAILRRHERGYLVYLTVLPMLFVVVFLLGELFVPH